MSQPDDRALPEGEDWDDWSPAASYGSALEALLATGAPLAGEDEYAVARGSRLTRRWCRAALAAFPAEDVDRPLTRRFLSKLVRDGELRDAWLAVLHVGTWDACCRFAEAHATAP
jgi:hypothetical protein